MSHSPVLRLSTHVMLVIPCSKAKQSGGETGSANSILSGLDASSAAALVTARSQMVESAQLNEKTLRPAFHRYSGHLYHHASLALEGVIASGHHVLIISGGYGLLCASESIGMYEKPFRVSDWPQGLLENCLLQYARRAGICSVVGVMSRTSNYAKLFKRVKWKDAGLIAWLVSPLAQRSGAMTTAPRAQGQAIATLIQSGLSQTWQSSDKLRLEFKCLGKA